MNYNSGIFGEMLRILLFVTLIAMFRLTDAQVKVNATPTGRHADALNQAKRSKMTAEQRREQARKLQQQVNAKKLYHQKYDSIKSTYTLRDSVAFSSDSLSISVMDSLRITEFTKEDSLAVSKIVLESADFPPEYRDLILNPFSPEPIIDTDNADSLALAEATSILEAEARKFMPGELGENSDPLSQFSDPLGGNNPAGATDAAGALAAVKKPSKPNPNLVKPEQARALFSKIDPEQFQDAQTDIQKLKRKYSELPDTRYPEEGTKRNSLEDVPFKGRIYFGGNLSLQSTDPVIINTNLQLGYWINKKWLGGVGIILREQFSNDSTSTLTGDGYGYSLFTRYDIPKGFFAWAEVERQINKSLFTTSENPANAEWQSAYLLGVGREFKIGFVQMMSLILYDFNYQSNDLNARPLVFRLGVRFSKKPG